MKIYKEYGHTLIFQSCEPSDQDCHEIMNLLEFKRLIKEKNSCEKNKKMKILENCKSGEIIKWNGYNWIAIDHDENSKVLLMKDILENRAFDENEDNTTNNWKECSLRKYLNNDFYNGLKDKEYILDYESDLMADNGDDDYGTSTDKIFLISMDFYRHHRKEITLPDGCWWTITPHSSSTSSVRRVGATGSVNHSVAYTSYYGVRPACLVSSSIQFEDFYTGMKVLDDGIYENLEEGIVRLVMPKDVFVKAFNQWCK